MTVFADALDVLMGDPNMGQAAQYRAGGVDPAIACTVLFSRPDVTEPFAESAITGADPSLVVRLAEIAQPKKGDTFTVDAVVWKVRRAERDALGLSWTVALGQ